MKKKITTELGQKFSSIFVNSYFRKKIIEISTFINDSNISLLKNKILKLTSTQISVLKNGQLQIQKKLF